MGAAQDLGCQPPDAPATIMSIRNRPQPATDSQPRMSPAIAKPSPLSPVRRISVRAVWPRITAGRPVIPKVIVVSTPQTMEPTALPFVGGGWAGRNVLGTGG